MSPKGSQLCKFCSGMTTFAASGANSARCEGKSVGESSSNKPPDVSFLGTGIDSETFTAVYGLGGVTHITTHLEFCVILVLLNMPLQRLTRHCLRLLEPLCECALLACGACYGTLGQRKGGTCGENQHSCLCDVLGQHTKLIHLIATCAILCVDIS